MPSGIALAMLTGPWFGGWRSLWMAAALGSGLIAALVLRAVPGTTDAQGAAAGPRARIAELGRGPALALATTFLLYSLMFFALFSFLPVLLQQRMQVGAGTVGLLAALASAANILGNLAAGALLPRLGRTVLGTAAAAAMAVGLLMQGSNLGQALGPLLVGNVVDHHGWPAAAACVVLAALAMACTLHWRARTGAP